MFKSIDRRAVLHAVAVSAAGLALPTQARSQSTLDEEKMRILRSLAPDGNVSRPATAEAPRPRRTVTADDRGSKTVVQVSSERTVDLSIYFAFDSDVVSAEGAKTLVALGAALRDPKLATMRVLVAGHTDAKGGRDYNIDLSFRRARSVREHLTVVHGIEARRLLVCGFGPTELKVPARPLDAANRRVEIALIVE